MVSKPFQCRVISLDLERLFFVSFFVPPLTRLFLLKCQNNFSLGKLKLWTENWFDFMQKIYLWCEAFVGI